MLKVFILSIILVLIALLAMSIRLIFDKRAEFRSGRCGAISSGSKDKDMSCGCGSICSSED